MNTISRPLGRFFVVLLVWLACAGPRVVEADGAGIRPPVAPSAGEEQLSALSGQRLVTNNALNFAIPRLLRAYFDNSLKLTRITDTVFRADGSKAHGALVISWPAFTTATQNAVAAGTLTVTLSPDGSFNANLAPTAGSTPPGVYYRVVYQIGDVVNGTNKEEYWAVPATDSTTISAVRAKLVPTTMAAQFLTRDVADTAYVHANDDQTVGGVKTFVKSPAVPNPTNASDAANKGYVDANAGGSANLSSPPPIGTATPNTVVGSSMTASASSGGDFTFNALRNWVQPTGEADWDVIKRDGSLHFSMMKYMPWFQFPYQNPGWLDITVPVTTFAYVGGQVVLGRYNSFQLVDPGPATCTVTHSGGTGSGASYNLYFADSNSALSLPSPSCSDPQGFTYAELAAGGGSRKNIVTYQQPGGYSNMLPARDKSPSIVVNDPGHQAAGVLSTLTSCLPKSACTWVDDGSWGNISLSSLVGAFHQQDRNTTNSMVLGGRLWLQGAMNVAGGVGYKGKMIGAPLDDPPAPTVTARKTGSTAYTYRVVFHDYAGGTSNVSPPTAISNGSVPPQNDISFNCYPNWVSADILSGDATHALVTGLPCEGTNYPTGLPIPYVFTDTGQSLDSYSAPARNDTADFYTMGNVVAEAVVKGNTVQATTNVGGPIIFGYDNVGGHGYVAAVSGDSGHTGYLGWYGPSGARSFYLGYDAGNALSLNADNGGSLNVATPLTAASVAVSGDLTLRDIPGHAYFVSKYPSIQAAINAAYGTGLVSGSVIDDRTSAYSGPGFYIPDSVTVRLAPVPYSFTSAVTHNNANNNVTAAIIVEQGAHLSGGGTSSNHGTTITVGSGFASDIVATSSVGTGTGASVQWWHWGSIENLNLDGSNQTAGECLHVENMGETSKVRDLLVKNCYSNNIEFAGAAATQSDIGNLTTNRSRNGAGVRFTNLSGVGKINGLSGDCNAGSLVSVQENAAGTLVLEGLKSEAESTICSNGAAHDPVVLLDTMSGLNTHVHIVGGYAFGTAQNSLAKVVGTGGGILEMEGFYVTGYTNLLNDTVRSVVIPATSMNSKQPFFYEPNGVVFANQAFTLTPGTGVMGGSTSLTPIFYATTGNATMVASLGNGDGQSIMTGGVELASQNRTNYGATPEVMARAGYRFTGSGYDTTKWDFVPAWNAGDTTEKNLGNMLNVCQKNGSMSCRWNHVYGANVDALVFTLGTFTVGTLPGSYGVGSLAWISDGTSPSDCSVGLGSTRVLCYYTGSAWTALTTGGGENVWGSITGTLSNQTDLQTALNTKAASNASTTVNGVACALGSACSTGAHLVSGTMVGPQAGIVGNGADQNVFSVTIPAGTMSVGRGLKCNARFTKLSTSNSISFKWVLGSTTLATQSVTSGSTNWMSDLEVFTPSSLSSQVANAGALMAGTSIQSGPQVGLTASENLASASMLKLTFNAASTETVTPKIFYCTTIQ